MDENVNNIRSVSTYDNKMYLDKIYMWNLIFGERSVFYGIKGKGHVEVSVTYRENMYLSWYIGEKIIKIGRMLRVKLQL